MNEPKKELPASNTQTQPAAPPAAAAEPSGWHPPKKSLLTIIIIVVLALCAIGVVLRAWRLPPFAGPVEDTDNAYVRGFVTTISSQVSGYVTSVPVDDFLEVKAGQILVTVDDRIYAARVAQAQANLEAQQAAFDNSAQSQRSRELATRSQDANIAAARAQQVRAEADMRRADALVKDGSLSKREYDQTRATLLAAQAALQQAVAGRSIGTEDVRTVLVARPGLKAAIDSAKAALRSAQVDLENTVIRAPVDGQLSEVGVRNGDYVTAGTQMMSLVPHFVWIVANYKEAQTHRMRPGQPVTFRVDALGDAKLHGHVERISPATGSEFAAIKPDNATGNFVKVAQRIAIRISVDPGQELAKRLRPGMSVETAVDTRDGDK
ncbi:MULTISPECIES: HlyD family secretion protein [Paraburkholderia]|uniref:HlyD family secretion protein n=1 Tax=Paraburkholderia TaxID=1822464 RepID=UPI00224DCC14|nr:MULTISPECIES: HlyD family secretion protein [Paraburkholderia]MCX4160014.1 HlyD family secretion protein [Paraburkholderia megapolitana]MDN7155514.1 HlyD family secretion protein [Paraburkholderia sp. CHISQ3]MDQ6492558.1 HlyD family secretion protein [Paraburkholderia megapolitana]